MAGAVASVQAFTPLMPFAAWQAPGIGYNPLNTDIGGPANLGEEYRWNLKTLYFGFDESFLNYFGNEGTNAVIQAIAILNALPPTSQMSSNLTEFPLNATRENPTATALGLTDLKSAALAILIEEMGLASPSRYTWTLRNAQTPAFNFTIFKRNFDPITLAPSSFVNGNLYTFRMVHYTTPATWDDAVEVPIDPDRAPYTAVADGADGIYSSLYYGDFYTGITRDDAGGLRYLYRTNNYQVENLISNATAVGASDPWGPVQGTNTVSSNSIVTTAVRAGVDKITFKLGKYDSFVGSFIVTTNVFTDTFVTNSTLKNQSAQRVLTQPDILFSAEDLGLDAGAVPVLWRRTDTAGWANNDAINGQAALDGPGVIQPQVVITFSKVGPYFFDQAPPFVDGPAVSQDLFTVWGSFDGTTNNPIIYPIGTSIYDYENQVLTGGGSSASAYSLPNSGIIITNTP